LKARGVEQRNTRKGKTISVDLAKEYQSKIDAAQNKRETVLKWLDNIADYSMILDIPTWVIHDKKASAACGITEYSEAVEATKYNNDYFMKHRKGVKNGGTKFLNVLQGSNQPEAHAWYDLMKEYCDPTIYPDTHFDGWAMGGQNMCDVELVLKRLVALRFDNLLQEGVHDWMHFLGTSKLEWAVLLTSIQRAVRKYINPNFTISFDCASPFLATANGQVYHHIDLPHDKKWCYRMAPSIDDKKYSVDTRTFRDVALSDYIAHFKHFDESPLSALCKIKDICIYKPGDLNKVGKEGVTSWDSFSYALQMGHNVWTHIYAVQLANATYDAGQYPDMLRWEFGQHEMFHEAIEKVFAANTRAEAELIIKHYEHFWESIIGTRGFTGNRAKNAHHKFNEHFDIEEVVLSESKLDQLEDELKVEMKSTFSLLCEVEGGDNTDPVPIKKSKFRTEIKENPVTTFNNLFDVD
jgi:hypothetical protein